VIRNLKELWRFRALIRALVKRHLAMRYRGSALGFLWSLLNPLCQMAVYSLVFQYYIRFNGVEHYPIFLLCGLLPWIWFTSALLEGTNSLVASGHLITKSMFPAHILPTVSVLTTLIHFLLALPLLIIFGLLTGVHFTAALLFLPVLIGMHLLFIHGITLALSALNVHFRDIQHILGNLLSFFFFLCPIVYPVSSVPEKFQFTLQLNPLALYISNYHKVILDGVLPSYSAMLVMLGLGMISVLIGNGIFNRYREGLAEML
jgi:lipopolysaccharide transport system permease protein